jgi:hypothetical protein
MMQRHAQDLATPLIPVVTSVNEVQMPSLVHSIARRNRMACHNCQKTDAPVLLHDPMSMTGAPAILSSQPAREGKKRLLVEVMGLDPC